VKEDEDWLLKVLAHCPQVLEQKSRDEGEAAIDYFFFEGF
jgi:hypothetical protein